MEEEEVVEGCCFRGEEGWERRGEEDAMAAVAAEEEEEEEAAEGCWRRGEEGCARRGEEGTRGLLAPRGTLGDAMAHQGSVPRQPQHRISEEQWLVPCALLFPG